MTSNARTGVIGLAIVAVLATGGCTDQGLPPATTSSPSATGTTPITTSTTMTAQDPELAAAEATVEKLWKLVDALGADKQRSLDELNTVARDQTLEIWRELLTKRRREAIRQTGSTSIVSTEASSARGKLTVDTCFDVSKTNLLDTDGKSVVSENRASRVRYTSVVERGSNGNYYVVQDKAVETC
ncbi:hypothetical protein [Intrasporangium calvum]|uniref:Lipoprotein n=2 Tax=Intrasporangium calvum TaxID=53358 RepID=E6S7I0_INTC7|nr:hypothetical protein [Intrasporangium calvum]ADU46875.1 hypothetical protein Intca_0322 [Intrasporangium calvum DSM 43043]AXG12156.1 hypothetical protein DN585_00730 [Intrasporangium calvum]